MEFLLPTNLQNELIPYDPTLKKLARTEKQAKATTKKSKYPLGNPPQLMPLDVVKESLQQEAVDVINASAAPDRHHEFKLPVGNFPNVEYVVHAVMYHYEGVWVAAWLPPKGKENDYVYGYTYCFKDTAATRKMLDYQIKNHLEQYTISEIGRSNYYYKTELVTKQNIIDGNDKTRWMYNVSGWNAKGRNITSMLGRFTNALKKTIPIWSDGRGIFDRIKTSRNLYNLLSDDRDLDRNYWIKYEKDFEQTKEQWSASVASLFHIIDYHVNVPHYDPFAPFVRVRHILDKPFFRKWIQDKCNEINTKYQDESVDTVATIRRPWLLIKEFVKGIAYVHSIWGDTVPLDYYQSNIDNLMGIKVWSVGAPTIVVPWLTEHMPVASFFQMLSKYYLEQKAAPQCSYDYEESLGMSQYRFHEWKDTCHMLNQILSNDKTIDPPKRWRITEFHDHVQAEAWKIQNPNHKLPQDLFPAPIKVQHADQNWSFFQPFDTHQLAQWGQAVRNCVGNASSYAEGVRKKQHFIVLCIVDGAPRFTIQLKVNMGRMSVKQIVGMHNSRLTEADRDLYSAAFGKALQAQEERLKSEAEAA
jgi:hypothetical protein